MNWCWSWGERVEKIINFALDYINNIDCWWEAKTRRIKKKNTSMVKIALMIMMMTLRKMRYCFDNFRLISKKKLRTRSKSFQPSKKKFKPLLLMDILLRKESLTRHLSLKSKPLNANLDKNSTHWLQKSTTSFQDNTIILTLTSKRLEICWLSKNKNLNTIISLKKRLLNFGLRSSQTVMFWASKSNREMSLCWNTLKKLRQENPKILKSFGLISTSPKTSGSLTPSSTRSLSLKKKLSKKAQETRSTGKKVKTSQSKSSRRKIKRKEERRRLNKWKKNHSLTFSLTSKSTVTRKMRKNKKVTRMLKI